MKRNTLVRLVALSALALALGAARASAAPDDQTSMGDPAAPVTIIEYSDYECPFCASFVRETKPELIEQYVATGKVYYIYRDNPLPGHAAGRLAAAYASCAAAQGKFWPMHDRLFGGFSAGEWGASVAAAEQVFRGYVEELGLDAAALQECLADPATERAIEDDIELARQAGVRGTPSYVLRWPGGPENGDVLVGTQSIRTWRYLLDDRLDGGPASPPPAGPPLAFYIAVGVAGGLLVLLLGGGVLLWYARRARG